MKKTTKQIKRETGAFRANRCIRLLLLWAVCFLSVFTLDAGRVSAAKPKAGKKVMSTDKHKKRVIAKYDEQGRMVMQVSKKDANLNYWNITNLVSGNKKKTIVIPKGSDIKINGVIRPGNNTTIIAEGATLRFKKKSNAVFCAPEKKVKNLTIKGGTWRSLDKNGRTGSLFQFAFVDKLVMDGVDCNANYVGHAIEIIACSNVTIQNCKVSAIGTNPPDCLEEQIQIDISTKRTAPVVARSGKKYVNGQTCKNIKILNNTVTGARAVGVNWSNSENGKWKNKFHKNIVIEGNTLTGTTSEALAMFNVIGGSIRNNKIKTKATRKKNNSSYTIGVHVALQGKTSTQPKLTISGNTIWGNRNGVYIKGYFDKNENPLSPFGKVEITGNKIYCKSGAAYAVGQTRGSCKEYDERDNETYRWD